MQDPDQYWSALYNQGREFATPHHGLITKILETVNNSLPKTCLDVGCGSGLLTRELYHRGYECVGVDASASAIKIAQSLTTRPGLKYIHLDFEKSDLPEGEYSLITCKDTYAFIKDKPSFLKKVTGVLAEGGTFVIVTPLREDAPPERTFITVDFEATMSELKATFKNIETFKFYGGTVFVASNT